LSKSKDPAFSFVSSPEVLLNKYASVAKGKPPCKYAELHCQMRSSTIPVGQFCTRALAFFIFIYLFIYLFFRSVFHSKSDMAAG